MSAYAVGTFFWRKRSPPGGDFSRGGGPIMTAGSPRGTSGDRMATLAAHLRDRHSGRVVFLAHCLLNQNTHYAAACPQSAQVPTPDAAVTMRWMSSQL